MKRLLMTWTIAWSLMGFPAIAVAHSQKPLASSQEQIQAVFLEQVGPGIALRGVTIVEGYAIARWQGEHDGGMISFQQVGQCWKIIRGTGGSFSYQDLAFRLNIPEDIAKRLIQSGVPEMEFTLPIVRGEKH